MFANHNLNPCQAQNPFLRPNFYSMAARHYGQPDPHHCHPTTTTSSSTVCCCCYTNYTPSQYPPVPDSYLPRYHQVHHRPTPHTHFCNPNPNGPTLHPYPPYTSQSVHRHHHQHQQTQFHSSPSELEKERYFHHNLPGELAHDHPIVSSLLRRIAALESSIPNHSASRYHSLRDAAARTIQSHFRAFLVRRSRTLRQLKDLASVKSTLNILKSSVSENTHFDPQSVFHRASRLLFKLDSIGGGDPMIRDGKKSISRELTRLLDFIDGFRDESSVISTRQVKRNVISGEHDERGIVRCRDLGKKKRLEEVVSKIDALFDKIPKQDDEEDEIFECSAIPTIERSLYSPAEVQAKAKKSVRFVENGKVYKASRNGYPPVSNGDSVNGDENGLLVGAKGQLEDKYTRKVEEVWGISSKVTEDDEEDQSHDGESTKSSDNEGVHTNNLRSGDGSLAYSAPLPVKMDSRTDTRDKRKTVK